MTDKPAAGRGNEQSEPRQSKEAEKEQTPHPPRYHPPPQDQFDWRGWLLVAVIFVSFLVVPATILYLPEAHEFIAWTGLSWRQAYLTLPLIPAVLLGATAIWAAVSSRSSN